MKEEEKDDSREKYMQYIMIVIAGVICCGCLGAICVVMFGKKDGDDDEGSRGRGGGRVRRR